MTQCEFCGETSFYPAGPHMGKPCPLKVKESEARIEAMTGAKQIERLERQLRLASDPKHIMRTLQVVGYKLPELEEIMRQVNEWHALGGHVRLLDIALGRQR